jgi:pimeloyl-ACP methyl ester carboxylesterase
MANLYETARKIGVPFTVETEGSRQMLQTPDLLLNYLEWGSSGSPTVILLHGFAQTAHSWDLIALSLADRYHVISVDARGHGDSEWAKNAEYSPADHRRDIKALINHLGSAPVTLVGLSMGGGTSYSYTAEHPKDIRALVIVDTGPVGNPKGRSRINSFVTMEDELDTIEEFVVRIHSYSSARTLEQVRSSVMNNVMQNQAGKWTWKYDKALRDQNRPRKRMSPEQAWEFLKSIDCETLLIRGSNSDLFLAETAIQMQKVMQHCALATVEDAGHLVPRDNPVSFLEVVSPWLDKVHSIDSGDA